MLVPITNGFSFRHDETDEEIGVIEDSNLTKELASKIDEILQREINFEYLED